MRKLKIVSILICMVCVCSLTGCLPLLLLSNHSNKQEQTSAEQNTAQENITQTETTVQETTTAKETEEITTEETTPLSYEEYKNNCVEMFYDDIFFGEENLKGRRLKLNGFISQKMFFTADAYLPSLTSELIEYHGLKRDFFKSCILRKDTDSYVGRSINVVFAERHGLSANDYKSGSRIVMYGEVIHWSDNTVDGFNSVWFVPKYIDVIQVGE